MAFQPREFVNIRQTKEKLIILILLDCLYWWLTYDFYDANGLTLRVTRDLFFMATGAFIVLCGLIIQIIYKKIKESKLKNK